MSKSDFKEERDRELFRLYLANLKNSRRNRREIFNLTLNSPAERFYVSEFCALINILRIEKGLPLKVSDNQKELYGDLYELFSQKRSDSPKRSATSILKEIIYFPAPKYYLSHSALKKIIKEQYAAIRNNRG